METLTNYEIATLVLGFMVLFILLKRILFGYSPPSARVIINELKSSEDLQLKDKTLIALLNGDNVQNAREYIDRRHPTLIPKDINRNHLLAFILTLYLYDGKNGYDTIKELTEVFKDSMTISMDDLGSDGTVPVSTIFAIIYDDIYLDNKLETSVEGLFYLSSLTSIIFTLQAMNKSKDMEDGIGKILDLVSGDVFEEFNDLRKFKIEINSAKREEEK